MALLCHCHGVTDRHIAAELAAGADGVDGVQASCGAGTSCGGCLPAIEALVERLGRRCSASAAA